MTAEFVSILIQFLLELAGVIKLNNHTKAIVFGLALGVVLPAFIISVFVGKSENRNLTTETKEMTIATITESVMSVNSENIIPVLVADSAYVYMNLEEYVIGVVLAEMPAEFEMEALKAQAVAARTYALKRNTTDGKHEHNALCIDPGCCQAYCSRADYLAKGEQTQSLQRVVDAVEATAGQVLIYDNALIDATYFSCSGGRTEDAMAVWGSDVPYLQAVDSPGEENAACFTNTLFYTLEEFADCMMLSKEKLSGNWLGGITYTDGGGIATIEICDKVYTGTDVRKLLELRSTVFVITPSENTVTVTTKGFGHRVGMSQYGAEAMAVNGYTYEQILAHYYQGTILDK